MTTVLEGLDWIVLGIYFLALILVAVWVVLQKNKNTEDYFLAGRNVGWFVIGASIFASNIGSEHVVGLAGTGFESGTPMAHYELHAWIVLLLGWLFLPFYIRSGAFTMPEFLEKRFDSKSRWFLSLFSLIAYVLTKVSVTIYAGGIVVSELLGIPFWYGAIEQHLNLTSGEIQNGFIFITHNRSFNPVMKKQNSFLFLIYLLPAIKLT